MVIQCAHGNAVAYPLANVDLEVQGVTVTVETAVSETLPQSVLLGTDVPELLSLLKEDKLLWWSLDLRLISCSRHLN